MFMKRTTSVLMLILLVLTLFAGCGNDNGEASPSGEPSSASVNFLAEDGSSIYRIVRPADNKEATKPSQELFKAMKEAFGSSVKMAFDDNDDGVDRFEILVGTTNRPETAEAEKALVEKTTGRYNDYIITVIGKKIVIFSESEVGLTAAVEFFVANFLKKEGADNIYHVYADSADYKSYKINGVELGQFDFVRPHFNSSYLTELEMESVTEFALTETGYQMDILHDTYTAESPSEYEIIVGNTSREGSEEITDYDKFSIKISGKKVYINGGSAHATAMGVSEFFKLVKRGSITDSDSVLGSYATALASYDDKTTFRKTWGDDFDGTELDKAKWRQENETNRNNGVNGKNSIRSTNPNDVFIHDGKFYICAREDENYYYGGMIKTDKSMSYKYGYLEASMLLPHGDGFWVALWACSNDSTASYGSGPKITSPEIDIVECFGNSNWYAANCHAWPTEYGKENYGYEHVSLDGTHSNEKKYTSPDNGVKLGDGFHTYGFLWDETQMAFVCDGDLYYSYQTDTSEHDIEAFNHNMFLIFSMATGFATQEKITDNPEEWANTNKYAIDWINIYQKNDGVSQLNILS